MEEKENMSMVPEMATIRKKAKWGTRTQKMVSFRADNEIAEYLESKQNKGRYLNELVRTDMMRELHASMEAEEETEGGT
ncbi:hypothetical protein [Ralstonia pseudosolanacearum]|uniref:hypothetical protein n=1 Tax=Ralstonia pseudosolanacearum TaxID=1310165 RepID=UPI003CE882E3